MTIKQQIIAYLQNHPEGIDDDELARVLHLSARQQANLRCRELEREGLVVRTTKNGKIHTFWREHAGTPDPLPTAQGNTRQSNHAKMAQWFWEGNVQSRVIDYLVNQGYQIRSAADTAGHQQGIDIVAARAGNALWVSVKGYPQGTEKTNPSLQAGHWFKHAIFDMIEYRERDQDVALAVALPDYPRYRMLVQKITWIKPVARFQYFWVDETGEVSVE